MMAAADIDVLTGDWLAELTMIILHKQRQKDPSKGYAAAFLRQIEPVLGTCLDRGVRIVSNAGGLNPAACAAALSDVASRLGLSLNVGYVEGDDIAAKIDDLAFRGLLRDFVSQRPFVSTDLAVLAANAYIGGWGIAAALDRGADVVVTGRVTDAAVVTGPAAWALGWAHHDWNQLAGAVAAGHVIECGAQATGGNFAFFDEVPGIERIGFPIAEIHADGSSVITKTPASGGTVTTETVTAQLLYEIQSLRYLGPDVTTHLDSIQLSSDGPDRVRITGALGSPPPGDLKVSMAVAGGYRNSITLVLTGLDVEKKAEVAQEAVWAAIPGGRASFDAVEVELIGRPDEDPQTFGAGASLLRIAVAGPDEQHVGRGFSSAVIETGLASYPGFFPTAPPSSATPYAIFRPGLVDATAVTATVRVGDWSEELSNVGAGRSGGVLEPEVRAAAPETFAPSPPMSADSAPTRRAPLGLLFGARSGDKGGNANLGVWARNDAGYAWLDEFLTVDQLHALVPGTAELVVERYRLPRLRAVNFVIDRFLGDGVASCLRLDSQAKGLAEYFRSRHADLPVHLLEDRA
jgi:hypothetical protein